MTDRKIGLSAAIAIVFAVAVSGCAKTINTNWVTERLGQTDAHWLGAEVKVDRLLILGEIIDPNTTGGRIIVHSAFSGLVPFRETALTAIDAYETPFASRDYLAAFGPKQGDPNGVYTFQLLSRPNVECDEYDRAMAAADHDFNKFQHLFDPPTSPRHCISYRYVGPLGDLSGKYMLVQYAFGQALRLGYAVDVIELRRGPHQILARQIICGTYRNGPTGPSCPGTTDLLSLINNSR